MRKQHLGFLLMVVSAVTLAISTILMKIIPQWTSLQPADVAIWRFSIAAPLTWLVMVFRKPSQKPDANLVWRFIGLGVVYAIANFCAVFALSRLSPALNVIIVYIYPSLVVLFSLVTGKPIPRLYWLGLPLTFLGLILTAYKFGQTLSVDLTGFFLTILNAFAMAAYLVLSERVFKRTKERLSGTRWVLTGAMLSGLLMIPFLGGHLPDSWIGWVLILSFGIVGTFVPILSMNTGVQLIGAARGSIIITIHPVLTVLFSTLFLGDELSPQQWLGGALVILAIVLLQGSPDRKGNRGDVVNDG